MNHPLHPYVEMMMPSCPCQGTTKRNRIESISWLWWGEPEGPCPAFFLSDSLGPLEHLSDLALSSFPDKRTSPGSLLLSLEIHF